MLYPVSVKALAAFTAKQGHLDLRFTPSPTAEEGTRIHQLIAQRRGADYQAERVLNYAYAGLQLSGRADGFRESEGLLEEIKSHRVPLDRVPSNHRHLAWAQLKLYGGMLCEELGLEHLSLSLVYVHVVTLEESPDTRHFSREDLRQFLHQHCEAFLSWAEAQSQHLEKRNQHCRDLPFPFESFRAGQRELAAGVYHACRDEKPLLAQATTGIGKTLATLFPQLKAMGHLDLDRIFYLSAKTPGRRLALDSLEQLGAACAPLRILELTALEKVCPYPENACHGESCPLANGFYDRLAKAREEATQAKDWSQATIANIADRHDICPYWFSHELAKWADVIVGDYNYYFDSSALLYALSVAHQWRVGVLVDEAHNLIPRARDMYSAELSEPALETALAAAPGSVKRALRPLIEQWPHWFAAQTEDYQIYGVIPERMLKALQKAVTAITSALADAPQRHDGEFMRFYFDAMHFVRLAEHFDEDSLFEVTLDQTNPLRVMTQVGIRNLVPAQFLAPRFGYSVNTTLFSATLIPPHYHQNLLGLDADTPFLNVPSPFQPDQLNVRVATDVSTRFKDREDSLPRVVEIIRQQLSSRPGNYIAFFSSYTYLNQVHEALGSLPVSVLAQRSGMTEIERDQWLSSFTQDSSVLGLAVLGGAFAEGIDLPGKRLIGVFITTLGMPTNSPLNETLRMRLDQKFGQGFDYAYRYPGIQNVIQAAGRVIRNTSDRGVVHLLDDRYLAAENRGLLPDWWVIHPGQER